MQTLTQNWYKFIENRIAYLKKDKIEKDFSKADEILIVKKISIILWWKFKILSGL